MADEDDGYLVAGFADKPAARRRAVTAAPPDITATRPISWYQRDVTPVFVDKTGRRGRWLGALGVAVALIALLLLAALWWSQVAATSG